MKRKNKVLARVEDWHRTTQAHIPPDRDHYTPCMARHYLDQPFAGKKTYEKVIFIFPDN